MFTLIAYAAETATETASSGGIGALGLDPRALFFQVLNFAILLLLLRLFAYKPIMKVLNDRRSKIEESLATANRIQQQEEALKDHQQVIMQQAQEKAATMLQQTKTKTQNLLEEAEAKGRARQEQLLKETQAQIAQDIATAQRDLQHEVVQLVAEATEKIIQVKLDPKKDLELIKETIASLPKNPGHP